MVALERNYKLVLVSEHREIPSGLGDNKAQRDFIVKDRAAMRRRRRP